MPACLMTPANSCVGKAFEQQSHEGRKEDESLACSESWRLKPLRLRGNDSIWTMRIALVRKKIHRVRQPENRGRKQEAGEHRQPGLKPDFLLIREQSWLSPANVLVLHGCYLYAGQRCPRHKVFTLFGFSCIRSGRIKRQVAKRATF